MAKLPIKPRRPTPPKKELKENVIVHTATSDESFSLEYLLGLLPDDINPKNVWLTTKIESDYEFEYAEITVRYERIIPNPKYNEQLAKHQKALKEYDSKLKKYKVDSQNWEKDRVQYLEKELAAAKKKLGIQS